MSYLVHLQQFEGPLGLLLYLIRKEEMDIFDINVGDITNQYFEYIRQMKELDLEVAGEFVAMAATLIQIKSRMLLPQYNNEGEPVELEDPRKELVQKLLDYQKYQDAAKQLYERPLLGRDVFLRGTRENLYDNDEGEIIIEEDGLFSLISAYRKSVKRALKAVHQVKSKVQSIAERVMEIQHRLLVGTRVMLSDLVQIGSAPRRTQLLVTFLSMLELGRMGYVSLFQTDTYGEIYVDPIKPIERNVLERVQEFDSGDAEAIAKSIIDEAVEEKIDMSEAMQSAHDLVGDHVQLALGESDSGPEHIADVEFAEALLRGETLAPEHVASDDEIFAAELELDGGWPAAIPPLPEIADGAIVASDEVGAVGEVAADFAVGAVGEVAADFAVDAVGEVAIGDMAMDDVAMVEPVAMSESFVHDEASAVAAEPEAFSDAAMEAAPSNAIADSEGAIELSADESESALEIAESGDSNEAVYEVSADYAAGESVLEAATEVSPEIASDPETYASFADSLSSISETATDSSQAENVELAATDSVQTETLEFAAFNSAQAENADLIAVDSSQEENAELAAADSVQTETQEFTATDSAQAENADPIAVDSSQAENAELAAADSVQTETLGFAASDSAQAENADLIASDSSQEENVELAAADSVQTETLEFAASDSAQAENADLIASDSSQAENVELAASDSVQTETLEFAASDSAQAESVELAAAESVQTETQEFAAADSSQAENVELAATDSSQAETQELGVDEAVMLADVELKSDAETGIEPVLETESRFDAQANDEAPKSVRESARGSAPESASESVAANEAIKPERGFHAETGKLNAIYLAEDSGAHHSENPNPTEDKKEEILPAIHHETRSGEGSAEA